MPRGLLRTFVILLCFMGGWWIRGQGRSGSESASGPSVVHTGPAIEQVKALSSLVTTRVEVADVVESRIEGYTGSMRACAIIKGDLLLGTDLSQAKFERVDADARTATIVLPQPRVSQPRVDHSRSRLVALSESGLWRITPDDGRTSTEAINRAYAQAQKFVTEASGAADLIVRSRDQAESVLSAFFQPTGWTVRVRWMD